MVSIRGMDPIYTMPFGCATPRRENSLLPEPANQGLKTSEMRFGPTGQYQDCYRVDRIGWNYELWGSAGTTLLGLDY